MVQSNKILIENNLKIWLESNNLYSNLEEYKYILKIDKSDTKELTSNIEEIMNFWVLPKNLNKLLSKKEIIELIVTGTNEIPLWIGIKVNKEIIEFIISKRFKKLKVVKERHLKNITIPFINSNKLKPIPNFYKEFCLVHPNLKLEEEKLKSEEFSEICRILNLENIKFKSLINKIENNVKNKNTEILKLNSRDNTEEFLLVDIKEYESLKRLKLYFRTNGVNIEFVFRTLSRWNERICNSNNDKIKEIELGILEKLKNQKRIVTEYKIL